MAMNVHSVTNAMQLQNAVTHFSVVNLLWMPTVLVLKLVRMAKTRLARKMSFASHRRPVPIQLMFLTRMLWM
jgi:hypothetical protein